MSLRHDRQAGARLRDRASRRRRAAGRRRRDRRPLHPGGRAQRCCTGATGRRLARRSAARGRRAATTCPRCGRLLHVRGRSDDMLKVSGQYVSPFEVEGTLVQHPAVLEAAVVGVPDADGLTRTKAFVVLKPGRDASARWPGAAGVHQGTPRTPQVSARDRVHRRAAEDATGKIQRFRLRERERARARDEVEADAVQFVDIDWSGRPVRIEYAWIATSNRGEATARSSCSCTRASVRSRCGRLPRALCDAANARSGVLPPWVWPVDAASGGRTLGRRLPPSPGVGGAPRVFRAVGPRPVSLRRPGCSGIATADRSPCLRLALSSLGGRLDRCSPPSVRRADQRDEHRGRASLVSGDRPSRTAGQISRRRRLRILGLEPHLARSEVSRLEHRSELARIECPMLASRATMTSTERWRRCTKSGAASHRRGRRAEDCRHSPHRDQPERLIDSVVQFMKATSPSAITR